MESWTCEFCGNVVERRPDGRPLHPVAAYENCELKGRYVGDECIAFRDCETAAKEIALKRSRDQRTWAERQGDFKLAQSLAGESWGKWVELERHKRGV